jgi:hypothetical protein
VEPSIQLARRLDGRRCMVRTLSEADTLTTNMSYMNKCEKYMKLFLTVAISFLIVPLARQAATASLAAPARRTLMTTVITSLIPTPYSLRMMYLSGQPHFFVRAQLLTHRLAPCKKGVACFPCVFAQGLSPTAG